MMQDIFDWFMVMANNKSVTLVIFVVTFTAIIIYVYGSKKRSERFESYRDIPFLDDEFGSPENPNNLNDSAQKNTKKKH